MAQEQPHARNLGFRVSNRWVERQVRDRDEFGNSLAGVAERDIQEGIAALCRCLPTLNQADVERSVEVARHGGYYYGLSRNDDPSRPIHPPPPIILDKEEKKALVAEREKVTGQGGIFIVILTVSLAAFLQGHVQSSINAGSLFAETVGINVTAFQSGSSTEPEWQLGGMNAVPFFTAALPGAQLSLPVNYCLGRRGALGLSAMLIIASSLGSAFCKTWGQVLGARVVGGIAMGIKAVSAPILASETAVGYWRGSTMLAWQLWVACGIMGGFAINIAIAAITDVLDSKTDTKSRPRYLALQWILGAPLAPAVLLLIAVMFCPESPRFYMRPNTPNYDLKRAYDILLEVRQTRLQATRDFFLIWWSNREINPSQGNVNSRGYGHLSGHNQHENTFNGANLNGGDRHGGNLDDRGLDDNNHNEGNAKHGLTYASHLWVVFRLSVNQYRPLFTKRRLRNALWSSCTVALAQQLCGINVFAFYSNGLFSQFGVEKSMLYTLGFGLVNFVCAFPAMKSIDTIGRRRWLVSTLPVMALLLMASAISFGLDKGESSPSTPGIVFIYFFVAAYSPGLGPIPFTLASESFPLKNREAGTSVAISINLLFAGLLTILLPKMDKTLEISGTLGFFSGMNLVAWFLIFFFVEETKQLSLEELDLIFDQPKRRFARFELEKRLPYVMRRLFPCSGDAGDRPIYDREIAMQNMGRTRTMNMTDMTGRHDGNNSHGSSQQ
ncbi:hypothetical protein ACJ41O_014716 [Fusarium nematophilum]